MYSPCFSGLDNQIGSDMVLLGLGLDYFYPRSLLSLNSYSSGGVVGTWRIKTCQYNFYLPKHRMYSIT